MLRRKGFTILELMIVIAVIAILIGIALPKFKGMRDEGNIARAKGEMRTLQTAVESYRIHQGSYPTALSDLTSATPNIVGSSLPADPFNGTANYGYVQSADTATTYYVIWSPGPNAGSAPTVANNGTVTAANVIYVSNGTPGSGG